MKTTTSFVGLLGLATFAVAAPVDDVRRALREPRAAAPYPIVSGPYGYGGTYTTSSGNAVGPIQTGGTGVVSPIQTGGPTGTGIIGPISTGVLPPPISPIGTGTAPIGPISTGGTTVITTTVTSATTTTTSSSSVVTTTITTSSTPTVGPASPTGACSPDGSFFCSPDGTEYALCNFGAYVYQPVAPGTICINGLIVIAGDGPCPAGVQDGDVVCNGPDEYALCNFGRVQFQPVAPGTQCVNGSII